MPNSVLMYYPLSSWNDRMCFLYSKRYGTQKPREVRPVV